jgi:hypothetical protein
MPAGECRAVGYQVGGGSLEHHPAAVVTGAGAEVDDPIRVSHHSLMVLDHDYRLTGLDKLV